MSTQKPLRKIYRESEDETARLGVTKRETRKMLRQLEDEIKYLEILDSYKDEYEEKEEKEPVYVPHGYSGFPDSLFLVGRIFMIMILALSIPFLFIATKETLPVVTLVLMLFVLNEGIIRFFGWKL